MDTLFIQWSFPNIMYVFPPPVLLPLVLNKILRDQVLLALAVAPLAPRQVWLSDTLELSISKPCSQAPLDSEDAGPTYWTHPYSVILHLHAWMLSGLVIIHQLSLGGLKVVPHQCSL